MLSDAELNKGFKIGDWEIRPARGVFRDGEQEKRPQPIVLSLLLALARRDGDLASKDDLIKEVWKGVPVGDDSITQAVSQLRVLLGDTARNPNYIKTVTKLGYRLIKTVELLDKTQSKPEPRQLADHLANLGRSWMTAVGIAVAIVIWWLLPPGPVQSIAVLPLDNHCNDPSKQYILFGIQSEIVRTLANVPTMTVKQGRVAYGDLEVAELASFLDVDAVLFSDLQCVGDALKISYRVARDDGKIMSSGDITDTIDDIFGLQRKVASLVRDDLFGRSPQELISTSVSPGSDAYDRYMRGLYALDRRGRGQPQNLDAAISLLEESIAIDPAFGPAYLSLATAYALLPDYRNAPLRQAHARAIEVVERGLEVDSSISDAAAAIYGFVYHKQRRWTQAEQAYLRATTARVVDSNAFNWYSLMLAGVGRLDDALQQILAAQRIDPSSAVINSRVGMIYTWLGELSKASDYFERADKLGASGEAHLFGKTLILLRGGELEEAARQFSAGFSLAGGNTDWIGPLFAAIDDPLKRDAALAAIDMSFKDPQMDPRFNVIARAVLGDNEGALRVAVTIVESGQFYEMDFLFLEELESLRRYPGFAVLMDKLGIQQYWDQNHCEWRRDEVRC